MKKQISLQTSDYRAALKDDKSLATFLEAMSEFDRKFCDAMAEGVDFTLRLEIQGNGGKMTLARVQNNTFWRPLGMDERAKNIDQD